MDKHTLWSRILRVAGRVLTVIGLVALFRVMDEYGDLSLVGSLIGAALIALSAFLVRSRFRRLACWGFGLVVSDYVVLNGPLLPAIWKLFPSLSPGRPPWAPFVFAHGSLAGFCASLLLCAYWPRRSHCWGRSPSHMETRMLEAIAISDENNAGDPATKEVFL
ncbi:MAG: hypothetical protein NTX94_02720 [Caldiserica bacterium]|nr:hypothetical protein [Caldisericota bacterium]